MTHAIENEIKEAIKSNKIFSVTFTKKDGSQRKMIARSGVKKHLKTGGTASTTSHIPKYFTVFDMKIQQYRNINVETISAFKCGVEFSGPVVEN